MPISVDQGCYVEEITGTGSSPQGEYLVGGEIVGMKHRPEVQRDAVMQPSSVGKHFDRAFGTGCWVYGDEAVVKRWPFAVVRDEVLLLECVAQCGDDLAGFMVVYSAKRSMSFVGRLTKPCTIMAPPPASANVRDCGKASAVRAICSCSGSRGMWLGCRARRVDQRTPRRPDPRRKIHLIPQANQLSAVDQLTGIVQRAFHEHHLVQVAPPGRVSEIPPDVAWIGS